MDDDGPSFTIYQDPPDLHPPPSTAEPRRPLSPSTRPALAEIRLLSWANEAHCDSALKHEMLSSQPDSSSEPPASPACAEDEESKENIDSRPVDAQSFKTPPRKLLSPAINRTTPIHTATSPTTPSLVPLRI
ncbi:hypothetical protein PTTG_09200 [Puccinia triticina 1-1 BBBD Race 1]|uniref:Uncharacterized protein n=2 Tax=Puccinia triticina TaxID=208348 RepID=A0A0C4F7R6_PUCT1|nr:uncharacterized protein PtA15_2A893 [Puccinia triticina]OAV98732.1 hypothetical protein PTTG_09200 [Puccinia triticina 1-1 BBBD Race 1]WAQ82576.1 hypothetical protein PtA15_2A893 [Puccinia triticina]WAR53438.1 hypothetical protein PtB15_2B869 [Puccinia triticina]